MVARLRQMAGLDWPVADYSGLCRRRKNLAVQIPYRREDGPVNLLVDSTGIKFLGDGGPSFSFAHQARPAGHPLHLALCRQDCFA